MTQDLYDVFYEEVSTRAPFLHASPGQRHFVPPEVIVSLVVELLVIACVHLRLGAIERRERKEFMKQMDERLRERDLEMLSRARAEMSQEWAKVLQQHGLPSKVALDSSERLYSALERKMSAGEAGRSEEAGSRAPGGV